MKHGRLVSILCVALFAVFIISIPAVSADQPSFSGTASQVSIQLYGTLGGGSCGPPTDNGGFSTIIQCAVYYALPGQITFAISAPGLGASSGNVSELEVEVWGLLPNQNITTLFQQTASGGSGEVTLTGSLSLNADYGGGQFVITYSAICTADLSSCVTDTANRTHIDLGLLMNPNGVTSSASQSSATQSSQTGGAGGVTPPLLPSLTALPDDPVSVGVVTAAVSSVGVLAILGSGPLGGGGSSSDESDIGGEPPDSGQTLDTLDGGATFEQTYNFLTGKGFNPGMVNVGGQLYLLPISNNDPAANRIGYAYETTNVVEPTTGAVIEVIDQSRPIQAILPPDWSPPGRSVPQPAPPVDTTQPAQEPPPLDDTGPQTVPAKEQPAPGPSQTEDSQTPSKPAQPETPPVKPPAPWHGPDGPGPYRLTLYVDDSDVVGHTYVSLTDANGKRLTKGVFDSAVGGTDDSVDSAVDDVDSLVGWHQAKVRDDGSHGWSVRKTYVISEDDYNNAIDYMKTHEQLCSEGKFNYGAFGHRLGTANAENCNIFAKNTMKEAGLEMPESWGLERPHNVASALRSDSATEQNATEGGYGTDASHANVIRQAARQAQKAAGGSSSNPGG